MTGASVDLTPDRIAIAHALERIAASENFRKAERCLRLLRYLVACALEGRENELKEYTLGVAVLERPDTFDPRTDPVVRLEARRLRLKLAEYYQHEGAADPVVIELPKGAYLAQFRPRRVEAAPGPPPAPPLAHRGRRWFAAPAMAALLVLAATSFYTLGRSHSGSALGSVAVLPFRDNSPAQGLSYFADGLRDGLTSALVHTKGLDVTARVSSGQPGDHDESPVDAGRRLQADTVVSGSVSPSGGEIQVVVALVDARAGKYLWSKTFQASASDLPLIEHSAALGIAQALGASADVPAPNLPSNAEAAELYLRARSLYRTRLPAQMQEAAKLLERVIQIQPDFAPAYAAAATNYLVAVQNGVMQWGQVGARGMDLARQSLALDPSLADAHTALALGWQAQWKWQECETELARAIDLDPRSPIPHFRRAYTLTVLRRFKDAEKEIGIARALDPSWAAAHGLLGEMYFYERRYADALELAHTFRATSPEFFDNLTARVYVAQQQWPLALPLLSRAPMPLGQALARAARGEVQGAYQDLLAKRRANAVPAFHVASFSALELHDRKDTLGWLEQAFEEHDPDLVSLALDPMFDGLRDDPRAVAILRKLNLAPESGPSLARAN